MELVQTCEDLFFNFLFGSKNSSENFFIITDVAGFIQVKHLPKIGKGKGYLSVVVGVVAFLPCDPCK